MTVPTAFFIALGLWLVDRPPHQLLGERDLVVTERVAVGLGRVLLVGRAVADVGAAQQQRRAVPFCNRGVLRSSLETAVCPDQRSSIQSIRSR